MKKKCFHLSEFLNNVGKNIPIEVYLATKYDKYRKQSTKDINKHGKESGGIGLWNIIVEDIFNIYKKDILVNKKNSFFVGDAAGRVKDHSDADINFAKSCEIQFKTPEEYFKTSV